jgi:Uncharacterized protein involved in copper resistance
MQLEVCAYNFQSCIIAEKVGAARVELCDNPMEGGTTPSYGVIKRVREKISIQLYSIIRPRGCDFLYDEDDMAIIKNDILLCKQLGCDGISTGVHKPNGEIDTVRLQRMVEWAYPLGVTCHRVFDATPDPFKALEDIIACGCERILTSGQKATAPEGMELLKQLVQKAEGRISIMPGAGVRSGNIQQLMQGTGATEFHTSARTGADSSLANEEELLKIISVMVSSS